MSFLVTDTDPDVQTAVYSGLLKPGHPFEYNCVSGHFAWPEVYSLGFCSICIDVTSTVPVEVTNVSMSLTVPEGTVPLMTMSQNSRSYAIIAGNKGETKFVRD